MRAQSCPAVPQYVHTSCLAMTAAALACIVVPVPVWARRVAMRVCPRLMVTGAALMGLSLSLPFVGIWYPAVSVACGGLTVLFVMFWFARENPPGHGEDDDEGRGPGGGGDSEPRDPHRPPGGIDWDDFDRERESWERTPVAV